MKKFVYFSCVALLLIAGGWAVQSYEHSIKFEVDESVKQLVVEGENALNIGRYADAKRIFEEELKINPQNVEASWGLKKAAAREALTGAAFKQAVDGLYQENSNDGHVNLFLGEYYASIHEFDKARSYYMSAIEQDPKMAEAHYVLAKLNEQQGNLNEARVELLKAISLSPESRYQNSLATIYFKQGQYELAVKEYGKNMEYPLSSLESAKIFWRLGYLSQALNYQRQAIEWLENPVVMAKPENQDAWYMETVPGQIIKLGSLEEKKSYGYLSLSATLYLHGNSEEAEKDTQKVFALKLANQTDINTLLKADLEILLHGDKEVADMVEVFKEKFLQ